MNDPVNSSNRKPSFREGLTRDIRFNNRSGFATRHGHVGRIGSGKSYQGKRALVLNTAQTEVYGQKGYRRNPMISNPKDRLRISKKKLKSGDGEGLTRREYVRRIFLAHRDANGGGALHHDTIEAGELFNNSRLKSSDSKYNVNLRPLLSYKEVNNDDKKCKYGKFRDGGRWRCAQNLNHKRGGGDEVGDRDSDGDGRDGRRLTADEHEAAYPHLYHQDDEDEEDSAVPNQRHRARRAADMDDEEEEEGGGGDFGDHAYEEKEDDEGRAVHPDEDTEDESAYARRIKRAKKERVRRKQAGVLKQLADYNKNPPRKSSRKK